VETEHGRSGVYYNISSALSAAATAAV